MRTKVRLAAGIATALLIGVVAVSCDDDDDDDLVGPGDRVYQTFLVGANEVGPTTEDGTGVVFIVDKGDRIEWTLTLDDISAVIASHIHGPALSNANAAVIVDLFMPAAATGDLNNRTESGSFTATNTGQGVSIDSLRVLLNNNRAYVNVHTTQFQPGAIRGQVVRTR